MVRFGGFFWKGPKDKVERVERKLAPKKEKEPEESTISDALEEIEAEETEEVEEEPEVSEPEPEEFESDEIAEPDIEGIEDELIQLEGKARIEPETTPEAVPQELPSKIKEMDEKINHVDDVLHDIKDESSQFQEQLGEMEETMKKMISIYEESSHETKPKKSVRDQEIELAELVRKAVKQKREAEPPEFVESDELPVFKPSRRTEISKSVSSGGFAAMELPEFVPGKIAKPLGPEPQPSEIKVTVKPQEFEPEVPEKSELGEEQKASMMFGGKPILTSIKHDYLTLVLVMRWIEFLLERTIRDRLSLVLDYYRDVGWITDEVKSEILSYARGEMQDVTKYLTQEEAKDILPGDVSPNASYKKVDEWRLSADDHLKSLLFIMKIADINVDRDKLNSLEQTIQKFKEDLKNFHGI